MSFRSHLLVPVMALVLGIPFSGATQDTPLPPDSPLVQELLARSRSTTSLKAAFTQEKHLQVLTEPIISHGNIRFEQPGKLRWQVEKPEPFVATMDGGTVRIRENGVERDASTMDKQVFTAIGGLISGILSGQMLSSTDMAPAFFKTKEGLRVEMTPKDARVAKRMGRVVLLFGQGDMELRELTMEQPKGDRTVLRFTQAEYGVTHPPAAFTLP